MRRIGSDSGASISLIIALVFPAIIGASLALAYYGLLYSNSVSRPYTVLFRDSAREEAERLAAELDARIDAPALALFDKIDVTRRESSMEVATPVVTPCDVDPGPLIESYAVYDGRQVLTCTNPPKKPRASFWRERGDSLKWEAVKVGSWHHQHEASKNGASLVIVFAVRRLDEETRYHVAARVHPEFVRRVLDEVLAKARKNLRVAVVDEDRRLISGAREPEDAPDDRVLYEAPLGKALYAWQFQIVPQNAEEFRAQAELQKRLRPVLIVLSTVIIAVGLGIVWLVVSAERRTSRLKSDFIANVSHELKTPLSLIRMFGEMVATGRHKGEGAAREYGGIITRESERLSHLIDNVLDFARLERGKASYDFAEADLGEVVERALDVCRYRLEKERLRLRTEIDRDLPLVRMDENAMTLVILNLVDNAIKYGADGGEVEVTLRRAPGGVVLGVRDFGPGIDRDEQARIFERFYRARAARDRNVRGSGIGLALVEHIAEAHGGRATVQSPPPDARGGALFQVHLPAPVLEGSESAARHQVLATGGGS